MVLIEELEEELDVAQAGPGPSSEQHLRGELGKLSEKLASVEVQGFEDPRESARSSKAYHQRRPHICTRQRQRSKLSQP